MLTVAAVVWGVPWWEAQPERSSRTSSGGNSVQAVRVRRKEADWNSRVVSVPEAEWQFLAGRDAVLELCYEVEPIDYIWERGRSVRVMACA